MGQTLSDLWYRDKMILEGKSLEQVLKFSGDGILKDGSSTSSELRNFLTVLPMAKIEKFVDECLSFSFEGSGFALQDLINELGLRLGFSIEYGLYRGKKNQISYDGFWKSPENDIVIEVKTTDTYSIDLDRIARYRNLLIEEKRTKSDCSSVLLIVGRNETNGLEAQIRGSKHAWDIRLISVDSLIKLIKLKEELLDNENTFKTICKILKPMEFTRLDYLIDTIFIAGKEAQSFENDSLDIDALSSVESGQDFGQEEKQKPVNFNDECVKLLEKHLEIPLTKQTRTLYSNKEKNIGLICVVSKNHGSEDNPRFWFAFHPHQKESLEKFKNSYVSFGCGSESLIFIFAYQEFIALLDKFRITENNNRMYWHVEIKRIKNKYFLLHGDRGPIDLTRKQVKGSM